MSEDLSGLIHCAEAARELGISRMSVRYLVRKGRLPAFRVGRSVLVPVEAVRAYAVERATREALREAR